MCDMIGCFARLDKILPGFFFHRWSKMFGKQASSSSNASLISVLIVILVYSLSVLDKCVTLVCSM